MAPCVCNPRIWEAEARGLLETLGQPKLKVRPCLKTEQSEAKQKFHKETKPVSADGSGVKCLVHEGLSLEPQQPCEMVGVLKCACNPSAEKTGTRGSWGALVRSS